MLVRMVSEAQCPLPFPAEAVPRSPAERISWLQLARSRRVGPATFMRLLREEGSAAAALSKLPSVAKTAGVKNYAPCPAAVASQEMEAGERVGARLLCLGEPDYPQALALIDDPPPVLWARGRIEQAALPGVALVGARNSSALGRRTADALARGLGEVPMVVISGLARGVDTSAHRAALETGTIAVLAGGVDVIYPRENMELAGEIAEKGLILSEMPVGLTAQARHFPRRNRIISGLSQAVVVVEGATKSGSLITARNALDQGREVMAVPGHPFDARASGCNMLIRDGATLVRSAADIIEALSGEPPARAVPKARPAPPETPQTVAREAENGAATGVVLSMLGPSPVSEDVIIRQTGLPSAVVLEALVELDVVGSIDRHPGGLVSRAVA